MQYLKVLPESAAESSTRVISARASTKKIMAHARAHTQSGQAAQEHLSRSGKQLSSLKLISTKLSHAPTSQRECQIISREHLALESSGAQALARACISCSRELSRRVRSDGGMSSCLLLCPPESSGRAKLTSHFSLLGKRVSLSARNLSEAVSEGSELESARAR